MANNIMEMLTNPVNQKSEDPPNFLDVDLDPNCCYSREDVMRIKETTPSKTRPDFLSESFNEENGIFSVDLWMEDHWKQNGITSKNEGKLKKKVFPKKEEHGNFDGLANILSPQRKGFSGGCRAASPDNLADRLGGSNVFKPNWRSYEGGPTAKGEPSRGSAFSDTRKLPKTDYTTRLTSDKDTFRGTNKNRGDWKGTADSNTFRPSFAKEAGSRKKVNSYDRKSSISDDNLPAWMDDDSEENGEFELKGFDDDDDFLGKKAAAKEPKPHKAKKYGDDPRSQLANERLTPIEDVKTEISADESLADYLKKMSIGDGRHEGSSGLSGSKFSKFFGCGGASNGGLNQENRPPSNPSAPDKSIFEKIGVQFGNCESYHQTGPERLYIDETNVHQPKQQVANGGSGMLNRLMSGPPKTPGSPVRMIGNLELDANLRAKGVNLEDLEKSLLRFNPRDRASSQQMANPMMNEAAMQQHQRFELQRMMSQHEAARQHAQLREQQQMMMNAKMEFLKGNPLNDPNNQQNLMEKLARLNNKGDGPDLKDGKQEEQGKIPPPMPNMMPQMGMGGPQMPFVPTPDVLQNMIINQRIRQYLGPEALSNDAYKAFVCELRQRLLARAPELVHQPMTLNAALAQLLAQHHSNNGRAFNQQQQNMGMAQPGTNFQQSGNQESFMGQQQNMMKRTPTTSHEPTSSTHSKLNSFVPTSVIRQMHKSGQCHSNSGRTSNSQTPPAQNGGPNESGASDDKRSQGEADATLKSPLSSNQKTNHVMNNLEKNRLNHQYASLMSAMTTGMPMQGWKQANENAQQTMYAQQHVLAQMPPQAQQQFMAALQLRKEQFLAAAAAAANNQNTGMGQMGFAISNIGNEQGLGGKQHIQGNVEEPNANYVTSHPEGYSNPVLVDFHADWCGPCKAQGPRLEARVNSFEGQIQLAKINVDEVGSLADEFEIRAVPTILAVKNGEVIARFEGAMEDTEIDQMIEDTIAH
uniref:Thioredoxin domain-containing protein n=1 Tax=Rhabditophanes sp. KR3021 TaxID=114890 RepID=A0AC35TZT9_9BILA